MEALRVVWDGISYCVRREDGGKIKNSSKICYAIAKKGYSTTYGPYAVRIYNAKDELDALKIFIVAQEQTNETL